MRAARLSAGLRRVAAVLARREPASVVLRQERTATDWRSLSARIGPQGELIVEGQDLGTSVEAPFGSREYEWTVTVAAADIRKLRAALAGDRGFFGVLRRRRGLLDALRRRFSGGQADRLEPFLKEKDIAFTFWNRIGD
jgi:hypothetical protein